MTKLQLLATLLATISMYLFLSCDSEDFQESDVYKVTPDLRMRINDGMRNVTKTERKEFNEKFDAFLIKCDEMAHISNPYMYMKTIEYMDFKEYVLNSSSDVLYLVMDKFLKGNPGFFSYIIYDLMYSTNPDLADRIAEKLKATATLEESFYVYPQMCLEIWLNSLEDKTGTTF